MTRENTFRFKQFTVLNDKTAMKVGTDGVLLGVWCDVCEAKSVLDVGTGCGLIALMIAQRNADCDIDCIDIDEVLLKKQESMLTTPRGAIGFILSCPISSNSFAIKNMT